MKNYITNIKNNLFDNVYGSCFRKFSFNIYPYKSYIINQVFPVVWNNLGRPIYHTHNYFLYNHLQQYKDNC